MHGEYNETVSGSNDGSSGGHNVESFWINTSIVDNVVVMSKAEIISMIDADGAGLGPYEAEITVDANAGNAQYHNLDLLAKEAMMANKCLMLLN